jgi:SulP family sulfate permease
MKMIDSLPLSQWLKTYNKASFSKDLIAGIIVAIILVPQSMAYALLAGVPAEYGLYCAIVPTLLYSFLGSSRHLSVAPAALISILVASSVSNLQPESDALYLQYVTMISFLSGVFLIIMRLLRFGHITRFISIPVISGFTSASAIIIATSQLKYILGVTIPNGLSFIDTLQYLFNTLPDTNLSVLSIGILCCFGLWFFKTPWGALVEKLQLSSWLTQMIARSGPLFVVLLAALFVGSFQLDIKQNIEIVGEIPQGLPQLQWILLDMDVLQKLALPSLLIALMCFLTSVAVGNNLAAKRKERLNPNQELLALGVANLGAAISGTFSLAASLSRSAVSYNAGSETTIANMISAVGVLITLFLFTSLFYFLPIVALSSIVIMSVISMIEFKKIAYYWRVNRTDGLSLAVTFLSVLAFGIDIGIGVGILCSITLLIQRASHPHIAEVGRMGNTEHFRNMDRHEVTLHNSVVIIRIDESLYFSNAEYIETYILELCGKKQGLQHLVLMFSAVNFIDASAIDMFGSLIQKLQHRSICLSLSEVKGPVMDQIKNTDLLSMLEPGKIYLSTDQALRALDK